MTTLEDAILKNDPDDYRKKLALMLAGQAGSTAPQGSRWAILAQALQGMQAGNELSELGKTKSDTAAAAIDADRTAQGMPTLGGQPQAAAPSFVSRLGNGLRGIFGGGDSAEPPASPVALPPTGAPSTTMRAPVSPPASDMPPTRGLPPAGRPMTPSLAPPAPTGAMAAPAGPPAPGSFNDRWTGVTDAVADGSMDPVERNWSSHFAQGPSQVSMMPSPNGPGTLAPMVGGPPPQKPPTMAQAGPPMAPGGVPPPVPPQQPQAPQQGAPQGVQQGAPQGQPSRGQPSIPQDVRQTYDQLTRAAAQAAQQGNNQRAIVFKSKADELIKPYMGPREQYTVIKDAYGNPIGQQSSLTNETKPYPQELPPDIRTAREIYSNPRQYGFTGQDDPELLAALRNRSSGIQSSVSVNNTVNPVLEGVSKQVVDQRKQANIAAQTIPMLHEARTALDQGVITGTAAPFQVAMQKVGALFGLSADQASNTEVFRVIVGNQVLSHIKELGANPSNADRDYIDKVMGGQITLEEKSLRRILDINEKYSRQTISNFNRDADKLVKASPDHYRTIAPLMRVDDPPEYKAPQNYPKQGEQGPYGSQQQTAPRAEQGAPAGAIQMLRQNPGLKQQFDAKYGPGASDRYLQGSQL